MVGRIIHSLDCVAEGAEWLASRDPGFARALPLVGALPLRREEDGFAALLRAIVGQQVSIASARAIWARLEAAFRLPYALDRGNSAIERARTFSRY